MKFLFITMFLVINMFGWVGEVTALKGEAFLIHNNKKIPLKLHQKFDKSDLIETKNAKLQIIFKDETVITVGKNSKVVVSDYVFDDTDKKAKITLKKGIMKTLTGKIGKLAPKRFKIMTKNASIGIRGTYFVVEVDNDYTKLGMLSGVTEFKPLNSNELYLVTAGEQLIFDEKNKKTQIKQGFVESKKTKILPKVDSDDSESNNDDDKDIAHNTTDVTKSNNESSSRFFMGFIEGLFK